MKVKFRRVLIGIYLIGLIASLLICIKPESALFAKKIPVVIEHPNQNRVHQKSIELGLHLLDASTVTLQENGKTLTRVPLEAIATAKPGSFTSEVVGPYSVMVYFIPSSEDLDNDGDKDYRILIRPFGISRSLGGLGLALFGLPLILLAIGNPANRYVQKTLAGTSVIQWPKRLAQSVKKVSFKFLKNGSDIPDRNVILATGLSNTVLAAFLYAFMEWFFFVTKPSFMSTLALSEKIKTLLITGLVLALISIAMIPLLLLVDIIFSRRIPSARRILFHLPATVLVTVLCIVLIDNFTYTLLKFGIASSHGMTRVIYMVVLLTIFAFFLREFANSKPALRPGFVVAAITLLAVSSVATVLSFKPDESEYFTGMQFNATSQPNIILISSDGMNAENMSVYGYERDTTPFLRELATTSLLSENNFTNASHSMGSEAAILSGKYPFDTRVLFPPDTLKGIDKYQHLPGILKKLGYRTVSIGFPYYVDVNLINFQNAFDEVNCSANDDQGLNKQISRFGFDNPMYFIDTLYQRAHERINHIFYINEMNLVALALTTSETYSTQDLDRLSCLSDYLQESTRTGQPLFAHVHMMGTHGKWFKPLYTQFSKGQNEDAPWMTDFYDDAILSFDHHMQSLAGELKELGIYDNTILVVYTDHGQQSVSDKKLPLLIRFPGGVKAGHLTANTQYLDIAPTILEYLGIDPPDWMAGQSLLQPIDPTRIIISGQTNTIALLSNLVSVDVQNIEPPFYQFGLLIAIQCQQVTLINTSRHDTSTEILSDHTAPCQAGQLKSPEATMTEVGNVLESYGYAVPDGW